jgi:hypothetical protein
MSLGGEGDFCEGDGILWLGAMDFHWAK